ncbi:DgyrCDS8411 [Dimorphilus gyrociliatus]|uniref:DgyrCDS8411 n=1 Tax=Dimorphilus gyrociliatus TaxID=2664684 RepID=A0A7I8VVM3_9ANNE|nr:DgyrCDS8411 [Dimorphilus gyrociliatus]
MSFRELDELPDIRDLAYEKTPAVTVRSVEELDKLYGVDENLSPIERAVHLLSSGHDLQRVSVVSSLPTLFQERPEECKRRVFPKVKELLHVGDEELQMTASNCFKTLLTKQILSHGQWVQSILPCVFIGLDNKTIEITEIWLETLLIAIDVLNIDVLLKDVLPPIKKKSDISKPVSSRITCCKVIGKISKKLDQNTIKTQLGRLIQSLCQDIEHDVRQTMCLELPVIGERLSPENIKIMIFPELLELAKDERSHVRNAALDSFGKLLPFLDSETLKISAYPLIFQISSKMLESDDVNIVGGLAKNLGVFLFYLSSQLCDDEKRLFIDAFKRLSKLPCNAKHSPKPQLFGGLEGLCLETPSECCRRFCVESLPLMVKALGGQIYKSELMSCYRSLCNDPSPYVKQAAAKCIGSILAALPSNYQSLLTLDFINLLKDSDITVLQCLMKDCPKIYLTLGCEGGKWDHSQEVLTASFHSLTTLMNGHDWRSQQNYMKILGEVSHKIFSSDQIGAKLIPAVYKELLSHRALPVMVETARTLLIFLRYSRKLEMKEEYYRKIKTDLAKSDNYRKRALFLDVCHHVLQLYSRLFFRQHSLIDEILLKCSDSVPNIRMKVCQLLPAVKSQLSLPADRPLLSQLESVVRKLQSDSDEDVVASINNIVIILDRTKPVMESLTKRTPKGSLEAADSKKEEEERKILEVAEAEALERQQEEKASRKESANAKNKQNTNKQDKRSAGKGGSRVTGGIRPAATGSRVSFQSTNSSTSSRRGSGTGSSLETGISNVKDRDRRVSTGSMHGNIGATTSGRKKSIPSGK